LIKLTQQQQTHAARGINQYNKIDASEDASTKNENNMQITKISQNTMKMQLPNDVAFILVVDGIIDKLLEIVANVDGRSFVVATPFVVVVAASLVVLYTYIKNVKIKQITTKKGSRLRLQRRWCASRTLGNRSRLQIILNLRK
jgi:hypothetical protein